MFNMSQQERIDRADSPAGYRSGGKLVPEPAKLKWRWPRVNETDRCCYVVGYDTDTKKPLFCGEIADYVAETGPGRATALCAKHFDEMGLTIH
jgi:hypothetical protein